ncbi:MAG TPA: hypothetical protein VK588_15605 [Chitinophagaceae bacterium]|nr:hypothetical protein [Chitinophagaceae bacterium]
MMYEILYRYLLKYKKIDLPGIGVLAIHMKPAIAEFVNRSISPPQYFFVFDRSEDVPPEKLFSWLSINLKITEQEAVIRFTDFIFDLTRQLREGKQITWPGIGILQKEFSGEIKFNASGNQFPFLQKVVAEKVTRQNAEHTIRVGESEKTSTEMNVLLHAHEEERPSYWWIWPVALIFVLVIFLGWHFSENNIAGATGNNQKISPANAPSGYSLAP